MRSSFIRMYKKNCFLLNYLENAANKSVFFLLSFLLASFKSDSINKVYLFFSHHIIMGNQKLKFFFTRKLTLLYLAS